MVNLEKEAIVLAGGFGTRLQSVVNDVPKPMAPIKGKPFLTYLLDYLKDFGFTHIVLSTGYLHEKIESYFGTAYNGMKISYAYEESPLGTGGGILNALQKCQTENVVVLNGDTLFQVDYYALEQLFSQKDTLLAIILRAVEDTSRYGRVSIAEDGRIIGFVEKQNASGKGSINGGIYMLNKQLFADFSVGQKFSFEKDIMEKLYSSSSFYAYVSDGYFIDIGVPEDYKRAQIEL
ncbi:MAG: nucleotidyltransferase family protein [Bacteroidales bacterium]|nr:nucleotidyltransferase family protein [Bacteroidales bacterium]